MWKRFKRMLKSWFGWLVNWSEDPEKILKQNIRELEDKVPEINQNIAEVKANLEVKKKEKDETQNKIQALKSKARRAHQQGKQELAEQIASDLANKEKELETIEEQIQQGKKAFEEAKRVRKTFMREKRKKIKEARKVLREHQRSEWQAKIADTMEQFQVAGDDATHREMVDALRQETETNKARMQMATSSRSAKEVELEELEEENEGKRRLQELVSNPKSIPESVEVQQEPVRQPSVKTKT